MRPALCLRHFEQTSSELNFAKLRRLSPTALTARFHEPESLAVALSKALDAGAAGVLANPSRLLRAALAELGRAVPMYAVLPDVPQADVATSVY